MIRVFVEGAAQKGTRRELTVRCQEGFHHFLSKIVPGHSLNVVPCGGRAQTWREFERNFGLARRSKLLLLIDSESTISADTDVKSFLRDTPGVQSWHCPPHIPDDCIHFMVQCMEAWILADRDTLRKFYGEHLDESRLPPPDAVLRVECPGLFAMLQAATAATEKGAYHKGRHSFDLIGLCSPDAIRKVSPFANRLFATLEQWTSESTNS